MNNVVRFHHHMNVTKHSNKQVFITLNYKEDDFNVGFKHVKG